MAYDDLLAARIRASLDHLPGLAEKKMFGGIGFLLHGNMACGVHQNDLIVRVGAAKYENALARPHAHVFDMTGRPMRGWITVDPLGCRTESQLDHWIRQGIDFVSSLPVKKK